MHELRMPVEHHSRPSGFICHPPTEVGQVSLLVAATRGRTPDQTSCQSSPELPGNHVPSLKPYVVHKALLPHRLVEA